MPPTRQRMLTPIVHVILQSAGQLGLERAQLLAAGGFSESDLRDLDGYVSMQQVIAMGREFARLCPDTNIGLAVLSFVQPARLGVLGYVLQHSPTLDSALHAFARYHSLLSDAVHWRIESITDADAGPQHALITVESHPDLAELGFPFETQVGVCVQVGRLLTGHNWSPIRMSFRHRPYGDRAEFDRFFGCPVAFAAERNQLVVPADALALPVVGAQPALRPSFMQLVETRLAKLRDPERPGQTRERVHALLVERISSGLSGREQAAGELGMSQRTLSRRLRAEGTSFREVLEAVRRELAEAWLDDPRNAVYEVAYLLGYSEPSTFHRSFRRWTGHSPDAWRQRQSQGTAPLP